MAGLSLNQATLVSIGCDPEFFSEEDILKLTKKDRKNLWPAFDFLIKRRSMLDGYFQSTGWGRRRMPLCQLKVVLTGIGLDIPPDYKCLLEQRFPASQQTDEQQEDETASWKRERSSLLSLVAAMGCEGYKFDPNMAKNPAVSDIGDDLDSVGLSLDQKTYGNG